jgi:hypothetical protein
MVNGNSIAIYISSVRGKMEEVDEIEALTSAGSPFGAKSGRQRQTISREKGT